MGMKYDNQTWKIPVLVMEVLGWEFIIEPVMDLSAPSVYMSNMGKSPQNRHISMGESDDKWVDPRKLAILRVLLF